MTDINEFNITDEELREIEQITELAPRIAQIT